MTLHYLAVLAATVSDFVYNEALLDVVDPFNTFHLPTMVVLAYVIQFLEGAKKRVVRPRCSFAMKAS